MGLLIKTTYVTQALEVPSDLLLMFLFLLVLFHSDLILFLKYLPLVLSLLCLLVVEESKVLLVLVTLILSGGGPDIHRDNFLAFLHLVCK